MTRKPLRRSIRGLMLVATVATTIVGTTMSGVAAGHQPNPVRGVAQQQLRQFAGHTAASSQERQEDPLQIANQAKEYANERSAPAASVSSAALLAARVHAAAMPAANALVHEVTHQAYNAEPAGFTDPYWSNAGAGFGLVSGRVTALAVDGSVTYAGTADGGVWQSGNGGSTWTSRWDHQPTLSIGALAVASDHQVWVGTGEANTNADSYLGTGVYRAGRTGSFYRVGGSELQNSQIYRLRDSGNGWMYAATSIGLYRHSDRTAAGQWQLLLKPDPNPTNSPYNTSIITDVAIRPGTHGRLVLAVLGWRNGSSYNGFYLSRTGGVKGSFHKITPTGAIDTGDIGRTTLAYAANGSRLYAIVESPQMLLAGADTNLQGVYVSANGSPVGPWRLIANSHKLGASGSALQNLPGYHVGIQSWYNQTLAVDPSDPMHVYVGLEEVFQTRNGGRTFTTASPYWNYGLACGTSCPRTTHPDQHALAIAGNAVISGNDGGVYRRPLKIVGYGHWLDLNAGLHTLQYYGAADGRSGAGSSTVGYWGGLQDNGTSLLAPSASRNVEPAGGDGGQVIVDPNNWKRSVGEYVDLTMYSTSDGGHTFRTISPVCGYNGSSDCDPLARFIAPMVRDVHNVNHWVSAGSKVWDTEKGWNTTCDANTCDWADVHSFGLDATGVPNVGTALAVNGTTTYAAWVGGGGNPGPAFASGIDTNYGGTWHRISSPVLPNRYIAGVSVDPHNPAHVYAVFNGYSRRWIPGGGQGVVFESHNGGASWHSITGNLPDAPGDTLAISDGVLVLATDVGVFTTSEHSPGRWSQVRAVPNASANDVEVSASGRGVVVATHGRGLWQVVPQ